MPHSPGFERLVDAVKARICECTIHEVKAKLDARHGFHLIDIREDREVARDRIAGATHIGRGVLERDIEEAIPDQSAEIVLYCGGGYRSALSADSLRQMGYTNVQSMAGGIKAWRLAGLPLESPPPR